MAGITGQGQTFNLPNYVGPLFLATPADTPFLSAIGGLTGGKPTKATEFQWQSYDRAAGQNVQVEGADAPAADNRVRTNITNLVEIHQEVVEVSYTKLGATGQYSGANIAGDNPVQNELDFQVQAKLKEVGRDVEWSFINGVYQKPTDNTTPRKTRGLLQAITTNVVTNGSPTALTKDMVDALLLSVYENGGIMEGDTATLMVPPAQKVALSKAYLTAGNYRETSRTIAGVNVTTINTDFGVLNVMVNRHMPTDTIAVVSLEECSPVLLEVPGKGFLFVEPLAKTGASEKYQLYGEIGLEYGNERKHGKITGLA